MRSLVYFQLRTYRCIALTDAICHNRNRTVLLLSALASTVAGTASPRASTAWFMTQRKNRRRRSNESESS